jgi:hypothetical protein
MLAPQGEQERAEPVTQGEGIEAVKNLGSSREELSGVGSMGCCDSRRWNRRGLIWSVAHNYCNEGYKPQGEILKEAG